VKSIRVHHALRLSNDPQEYILEIPAALRDCGYKAVKIIRCPYGQLVLWREDRTYMDAECPKCHGDCEQEEEIGTGVEVWADADGNVIEPDVIQHDQVTHEISGHWIKKWVQEKQGAAI
jgi:phage FluMu protein Com